MHTQAKNQVMTQQTESSELATRDRSSASQNHLHASILRLHGFVGNAKVQRLLQPRLAVNAPGDRYEREADDIANQVMRAHVCDCGGTCPACRAMNAAPGGTRVQTSRVGRSGGAPAPPEVEEVLRSPGRSLDPNTRTFFEDRFGFDLGHVRVHVDDRAAESAQSIHALAYTSGRNMVFGPGAFAPHTSSGRHLLAHELAHVVQQGAAGKQRGHATTPATTAPSAIQRTIGDGHDLTSPRFSLILDLEAAFDGEMVIGVGSKGRAVQAIQQSLYDLGYSLPAHGADGDFQSETRAAVKKFQKDNPPLVDNGEVNKPTMEALNTRFATPATLPAAAALAAAWTPACVCSVLCPWSPHTVDVLHSRITVKSFDSISWADERWDGSSWVSDPFPGGGYQSRAAREIGVLNESCESVAETLYHEVLHAEQPTTHRTTLQKEAYAYRIGEEFSIAMGLGGRSDLRSMDARWREFADRSKVETFVSTEYPSVSASAPGEQIVGKAATLGHVRVRRPNGTFYTRPAAVDEKIPGPMSISNEKTHPDTDWDCP